MNEVLERGTRTTEFKAMTDKEKLELLLKMISASKRREFEDVVKFIESQYKAKNKK